MSPELVREKWAVWRSAIIGYTVSGALGAALGAYYGFRADLNDSVRHSSAASVGHASPFAATIFGAAAGFVAGLLFRRLRWMRERGGIYYFFSWGLSVGAGVALALLPTILRTKEWLAYGVGIVVGILAGFGLGAVILHAIIKDESRSGRE